MTTRHKYEYGPHEEYIVPPGCTPRTNTYRFFHHFLRHKVSNPRSQRPFPAKPLESMTPQAEQWERSNRAVKAYHLSEIPCPHGGVHGPTYRRLHFNTILYDSPFSTGLHTSDLWASKARADIESHVVNLGTTLAEYRASARMFGNFAKTLHNGYKVLRGRMPRRKIRACSIPAAHLQYSYGVGPLASDLYDSIEALTDRMESPFYRRFSSFGKETLSGSDIFGSTELWKWESTKTQRAIIHAEFEASSTDTIGFGNPIEWAWELIPFSFVVDWAIPVGEWLHSLDALKGVKSLKGTVTTKWDYFHTSEFIGPDIVAVEKGGMDHKSHKREVVTSIPIPPPPKYEPSKSLKTIANGLALLWGMSKTCRK